jgi:AraC-like DNA-binding protein
MPTPALPQSRYRPELWLWPAGALYLGPSLRLGVHSGSVSCLAVAMNGTFTVEQTGTCGPRSRSALIPARLKHRVVTDADSMAFCYFDPGSVRHQGCQGAMTKQDGAIAYGHQQETALASTASAPTEADGARAWLDLACGPTAGSFDTPPAAHDDCLRKDARIEQVLTMLRGADLQSDLSAARLASLSRLSSSRFLHLFRQHTGTSLRRYRIWLRMMSVARGVRDGADLSTAATDAGFASPSHFSTTFHAMFGLPAKHLLGTQIHLDVDFDQA